jgi:hypothetical protein
MIQKKSFLETFNQCCGSRRLLTGSGSVSDFRKRPDPNPDPDLYLDPGLYNKFRPIFF